jgi:DNA-binding XRE family transcriptional regulator
MKQAPRFGRQDLPRLGRQLRALRIAAGLTQAALAARAGVSAGALRAAESGRSNPALPTALALAAALGTTVERLVTRDPAEDVALSRAGGPAATLPGAVLAVRAGPVPEPAAMPRGAVMVLALDGPVTASVDGGPEVALDRGDCLHARPGALAVLAGGGRILCIADRRSEGG